MSADHPLDPSPHVRDRLMAEASAALAGMDYLTCEARCVQALALARSAGDWSYYGRVLMPLQEARRQRRAIAAEGLVRLGTSDLPTGPAASVAESILEHLRVGCLVVTRPHPPEVAAEVAALAVARRRFVEVLYGDTTPDRAVWMLRPFGVGQRPAWSVECELPAPPAPWRDRWIDVPSTHTRPPTPADWFIDATEALGDAALTHVLGRPDRLPEDRPITAQILAELERCLDVVPDHEFIHQRLLDAARDLTRHPPSPRIGP